jgi:molybdate transport system substrate-binding protein
VASNFAGAAREIAAEFEAASGVDARITAASTGKLYAQVINGAPFDVLLAADRDRPQKLEASGEGVSGTRFVYAVGALLLWSRELDDCRGALNHPADLRIAIANPAIAPYGAAARQFLERAGLWDDVGPRLVTGENISQTLQFVASGNAELGFIASAQQYALSLPPASCTWPVPLSAYDPIVQEAILLQHGEDSDSAHAFLSFLRGAAAREIILKHGYRLAGDAR